MNTVESPVHTLDTELDRVCYLAQKTLEYGSVQDQLLDDFIAGVAKTQLGHRIILSFKPWRMEQYLKVSHEYRKEDLFGLEEGESFLDHADGHARNLVRLCLADAFTLCQSHRG